MHCKTPGCGTATEMQCSNRCMSQIKTSTDCVASTPLKQQRICTHFSLYFIIQELLFEGDEGIVCTVVVQIQWVQHIPESDTDGYDAF